MPQFTRFPFVPAGDPSKNVTKLIELFAAITPEGNSLRDLRSALKSAKMWLREDQDDLWRFFQVAPEKTLEPSDFTEQLAGAEDDEARQVVLAERLWTTNPLLFSSLFRALGERPHTRDELVSFVASSAYRGEPLHRAHLLNWIQIALGSSILKTVGISVVVGPGGAAFAERVTQFELEEFLEEDEPEPDVVASASAPEEEGDGVATPEAGVPTAAPAAPSPVTDAAAAPARQPSMVSYTSPLGRGPQVPLASFASEGEFPEAITSDTKTRIDEWWAEQTPESRSATAADFGIDSSSWLEGADEALYRVAVAAALVFRLGRTSDEVIAAYRGLDGAGVLSDLYFGTAPAKLPAAVDSQALMLASLVARRCAESPELAVTLEKQKTAKDAYKQIENALGRGLFSLELFWIMRALGDLGVMRFDDLRAVSAIPTRAVRDTLFRLGFVPTPYATTSESLLSAAQAAGQATSADPPDAVLEGFAAAAGCQYACPHRNRCELACRERADLES